MFWNFFRSKNIDVKLASSSKNVALEHSQPPTRLSNLNQLIVTTVVNSTRRICVYASLSLQMR